jgi:transposase
MDKLELTEDERRALREQHRRSPRAKAADRIKAILLLSQGYTRKQVAEILLRDEETISAWRERYLSRKSLEEWLQDDYQGYSGKLNAEQEKAVETFVEENLVQDARQVVDFIQEQFGIEYQVTGIHALLRRLGFSYKQTTLFPSKMNPEEQKGWQTIFDEARKNINGVVLYMDGVHPQHNSCTGKAWIRRGEQKFVPSNTGRKRLNINGAYNVDTQEIVTHFCETINAQTTIELFTKIEAAYPMATSIYLVCDNASYYRNEIIETHLSCPPNGGNGSRIKLVFLPTYSPNLNLIERVWKFMKKKVIKNKYYPKFKEFQKAVGDFFDNLAQYADELKRFVGTKPHFFHPVLAA